VGEVVVVVERLGSGHLWPADGELAAGVDVAEEHVRHGVAALCAGIPGFEDGRNVLGSPADVERAAVLLSSR
jgi:hypothetical protein